VRDIFSEGLLYLDLLQIYGSTYAVAEICGIAQSNVFRGASSCSKLLNLGLAKDRQSGRYQIQKNLDVQRDLRKLNQRLRARENGRLRVLGNTSLLSGVAASSEEAKLYQLLPTNWEDSALSLEYLEQALVDLVLIRASALPLGLSWPAPLRRPDLFIPVDQFAATEIGEAPLLFAIHASHQAANDPTWSMVLQSAWLVDASIPLPLLERHYPDVSMRQRCLDPLGQSPKLPSKSEAEASIWLTDPMQFEQLCSGDPQTPWRALAFDVSLGDPLLAVTLLPLIREPLHQALIDLLRTRLKGRAANPMHCG
jgi:hypothetical protein